MQQNTLVADLVDGFAHTMTKMYASKILFQFPRLSVHGEWSVIHGS